MQIYQSSDEYLYNLETSSPQEAKRLWKNSIKNKWEYKCAYCGSDNELTIDHIVPQSKGGSDYTTNVVCCCKICNQSKGHLPWKEWYKNQTFFSEENYNKIINWISEQSIKQELYTYGKRRNNLS
jgi:hypothetical protein